MEMEHINENLIKVLIDTQDLAERGINFLDLIGDQNSIEKFFYSILEEVDVDQHFQESDAVTFQVMPNKDGLELYISRNNFEEMETLWDDEITKRLLERKRKSKSDRQRARAVKMDSSDQKGQEMDSSLDDCNVIRFDNLEAFLQAARNMKSLTLPSSLYVMNDSYYVLFDLGQEEFEMTHPLWTLLEYGEVDEVTQAVIQEHGQLIRAQDALNFFSEKF